MSSSVICTRFVNSNSKGATKSRNKSLENITKLPFFVRKIKSSKVKRDQLFHFIDHMPKYYVHVSSIFIFLFLSLFWFIFSLLKKNQFNILPGFAESKILDIGRPIPNVTIYIILVISNEKKKTRTVFSLIQNINTKSYRL